MRLGYVTLRYLKLRYVKLRYVTLRYVTFRYMTLRYITNGNLMEPIIVLNEHLLNSRTAAPSNDHSTM